MLSNVQYIISGSGNIQYKCIYVLFFYVLNKVSESVIIVF